MLSINRLAGIINQSGTVVSSGSSPLILNFGTPTTEQMGVRVTLNRALAIGSTVQVEYKQSSSSTWISDRMLEPMFVFEVFFGTQYNTALGHNEPYNGATGTIPYGDGWPGTANGVPGIAPADGFTGFVYHLTPGTTYDVRLKLTESSVVTYNTAQQYTTSLLPVILPTANKTCTPGTITTALSGLVPGDHLQLQSGTYAPFSVSVSGTVGNPIYISCATGATVHSSTTGRIITISGDYIVFDTMTITGTGVDSELNYKLNGGSLAGVYSEAFYQNRNTAGITIRNSNISGVDVFCKAWKTSTSWLIYGNTISGNNAFDVRHSIPPGATYPNAGWNDSGVNLHGLGNCIFQNTWSGFGDTWKNGVSTESYGSESRGNFFYRNLVQWGADDGVEMDNSVSGGVYHNVFMNTAIGLSVDGTFEGPIDFFGNVVIAACRGPLKPSSESYNVKVINNTFVLGDKQFTNYGMYISYAEGPNTRLDYINNAVVYSGVSGVLSLGQVETNMHWNHNAWYPDRNFDMRGVGSATTLAAMKTVAAPHMTGDVVTTSNPFASTITVGGYTTQYLGGYDITPLSGASLLNAGIHVPGFTNGYTGAAPTMGAKWGGQPSFTVGVSGYIAPSVPSIPTWRSSMPANTWTIIPAINKLSDLDPINDASITPSGADWVGAGLTPGGFSWCTMVMDPATDNCYIPLMGGHHDYGGNDGYKVIYNANNAVWSRFRLPSGALPGPAITTIDGTESTGLYSDGRIRAQHTYGNMAWVPGVGPVLGRMTAFWYNPSFIINKAYSFDPVTGVETLRCDYTSITGLGSGEGCLEYDTDRNCLWYIGTGTSTLLKFTNLGSPTWTVTKLGVADNWIKVGGVIRHCPTLDVLVQFPCNNGLGEIGIRNPTTYAVTYPTLTGSWSSGFDLSAAQQPGFAFTWCAPLGKFLIWHNPTGSTTEISTLTPPATIGGTWVKGVLVVAPSNAVAPSIGKSDGTFGRGVYLPNLKGFALLNRPDQVTYFFATE